MPCLSLEWKNTYNFIRWKRATTLPLADLNDATTCDDTFTGFANNYKRNCREYYPSFVLASQLSIYANFTTAPTDGDSANWRVVVYDWYGNDSGVTAFAPSIDVLAGGGFNFYFSLTPTSSNFTDGQLYRFVVYENSGDTVIYVSNWFFMRAAANAKYYAALSYRNSNSVSNFNYSGLGSLRNRVWVDLNLIDFQPELEFVSYREASTGKTRNSKVYKNEGLSFKSLQFDFEAYRAMLHLSECDDILFNTNVLTVKEAYKPTTNPQNNLHDGVIVFENEAVSTVNLSGFDG